MKTSCSKSKSQGILGRYKNNHQLCFEMDQTKRLWDGQIWSPNDIVTNLNSCIKNLWKWELVTIVVAKMEPVANRCAVQHLPLLQHALVSMFSLSCCREQGLLLANRAQRFAAQDKTPRQSMSLSGERYLVLHQLCVLQCRALPDQGAAFYRSMVNR